MLKIKNTIPNIITSLNLISGLAALMFLFYGNFGAAVVLVIIASVFDFFDGMMARILNAKTEFGKQLDTLADTVSFGVVPGFMAFLFLEIYLKFNPNWPDWLSYSGFCLTLFAVYRLARFNSNDAEEKEFTGLAVPAMALFISGLIWYLLKHNNEFTEWLSQVPVIIAIIVLLSTLMISNLRMFSLKFEVFRFKNNEVRWVFLIISAVLLFIFRIFALPLVIGLYVIASIGMNILNKKT